MKECPACLRCFPDDFKRCPVDGDPLMLSIRGDIVLEGRYKLDRRIGQGGMGMVFKAHHLLLKSVYAIKVILPDTSNDPMLVTRFRQEAMVAASIRHSNVVAVTDFGVAQDTLPFLVMEFIKGRSLHNILSDKGRLSPEWSLEIIAAVAAGVGVAHRQGIVHRDLKPLNIMLQDDMPTEDAVKVLDFGLAKIKSGDMFGSFVQAQTAGVMGSPLYMAPEQWSDEEPDSRADIYSMGIILYQMLTGDVPFKGASIPSIMKKHLTDDPPAFDTLGVHVPPRIEYVVRHALQKEVDRRPQSVEDFIDELREAVDGANASRKRTQRSGSDFDLDTMSFDHLASTIKFGELTSSQGRASGKVQRRVKQESVTDLPSVAKQKKAFLRAFPWIAIGALVLAVSSYGVYRWLRPTPVIVNSTEDQNIGPPTTIGVDMVLVSGGSFRMGRDDLSPRLNTYGQKEYSYEVSQWPAHIVTTGDFYMDRTEVTNAEYAGCVREAQCPSPSDWIGNKPPAEREKWPVVSVSFQDAQAFAAWRSKRDGLTYRLPTEEEWEYAARGGSKNYLYPWGNTWRDDRANVGSSSLKPIGSYPLGASVWGMLDLIGNAQEWTSSKMSLYSGNNKLKLEDEEREYIVVRGGSYLDEASGGLAITATRRQGIPAPTKYPTIGFRLVR